MKQTLQDRVALLASRNLLTDTGITKPGMQIPKEILNAAGKLATDESLVRSKVRALAKGGERQLERSTKFGKPY
jgi:hypothetical protein